MSPAHAYQSRPPRGPAGSWCPRFRPFRRSPSPSRAITRMRRSIRSRPICLMPSAARRSRCAQYRLMMRVCTVACTLGTHCVKHTHTRMHADRMEIRVHIHIYAHIHMRFIMRPLYAEKIHARHTPAITAHTSSCFPRLFRPTTRPASLLRLGRIQSRRSPRSAHERIQFDTHLQHAAPCHNFPGHLSLMYAALADMYVPHDYTHARKRRRSCPRRPRWSRLRRPKRSRQKRGRCACYIIT